MSVTDSRTTLVQTFPGAYSASIHWVLSLFPPGKERVELAFIPPLPSQPVAG